MGVRGWAVTFSLLAIALVLAAWLGTNTVETRMAAGIFASLSLISVFIDWTPKPLV